MAIAKICPRCGSIVVPVPILPVKTYLKEQFIEELPLKANWHVCPNQKCPVTYFTSGMIFTTHDLTTTLWFKNKSLEAPICYCANITRGDIETAVKSGYSTIKAVRTYLKKDLPCDCKRLNPLGGCCCEAFNYEIDMAIAKFE
jgi:bacterioferritin-associated ferredoxin